MIFQENIVIPVPLNVGSLLSVSLFVDNDEYSENIVFRVNLDPIIFPGPNISEIVDIDSESTFENSLSPNVLMDLEPLDEPESNKKNSVMDKSQSSQTMPELYDSRRDLSLLTPGKVTTNVNYILATSLVNEAHSSQNCVSSNQDFQVTAPQVLSGEIINSNYSNDTLRDGFPCTMDISCSEHREITRPRTLPSPSFTVAYDEQVCSDKVVVGSDVAVIQDIIAYMIDFALADYKSSEEAKSDVYSHHSSSLSDYIETPYMNLTANSASNSCLNTEQRSSCDLSLISPESFHYSPQDEMETSIKDDGVPIKTFENACCYPAGIVDEPAIFFTQKDMSMVHQTESQFDANNVCSNACNGANQCYNLTASPHGDFNSFEKFEVLTFHLSHQNISSADEISNNSN